MRPSHLTVSLAIGLALGSTGCIKSMLLNGQISATREASSAFLTLGDFEMARAAAAGGLVQVEGMHQLAPDNADALFMLAKSWVSYGFAFCEDDMEIAEDAGDDDLTEYHRKRARMAYDRGVFYGLQLLAQQADGFEQAKKTEQTLVKWLSDNFTSADDAANLFWTGYGWMARANVMKGDDTEGPALIAELYIGVTMVERALAIDPSIEHYSGQLAMAVYHARTGMAEVPLAKQMLDTALARSEGKNLLVPLNYGIKFACIKGDAALYQDMLNKVLQVPDPDPTQRLSSALAKRKAKRWLGKRRAKEQCGIDLTAPK